MKKLGGILAILGAAVILVSLTSALGSLGMVFQQYPGYSFQEIWRSTDGNCIRSKASCPSTGFDFCYVVNSGTATDTKELQPGEKWSTTKSTYSGCTMVVYGASVSQVCSPNAQFCGPDGKTIQTCSSDGQGINDLKTCDVSCVQVGALAKCKICQPFTEKYCSGKVPMICDSTGTSFTGAPACQIGCVDGSCVECPDSQTRCSGDTLQVCSSGKWSNQELCQEGCATVSGGAACNGPSPTCGDGKVESPEECDPPGTKASCDVSGVPGQMTCTDSCQWSSCAKTGTCVPGETKGCGECGSQECDSKGLWGECVPEIGTCGEGYSCAPY